MINRSVNIRIALQSALSRADGSDSRCSVRASELLTNRMGWLDNCSIDCFSTSSDFIFHATKCRPHTTDITASIVRVECQFKLKTKYLLHCTTDPSQTPPLIFVAVIFVIKQLNREQLPFIIPFF